MVLVANMTEVKINKLHLLNFILSMIILFLFAFIGYKVGLTAEDSETRFIGYFCFILFSAVFIIAFVLIIRNTLVNGLTSTGKNLKLGYEARGFGIDLKQDPFAFSVIRKNPFILLINLGAIFLVFPITMILLMSLNFVDVNRVVAQGPFSYLFLLILPIYMIISFSFFNATTIALILIGEILQTRLSEKKFSTFEVVQDYFNSFPLIIILTVFGALFMFIAKVNDNKRGIGPFLSVLGAKLSMDVLRNFTAINIGIIAIENKSLFYSIRESISIMAKGALKLASINISSGIFLFVFFLLACALFLQSQNMVYFILFLIVTVLFLIAFYISEQIAILRFIIKERHPGVDVKKVFGL